MDKVHTNLGVVPYSFEPTFTSDEIAARTAEQHRLRLTTAAAAAADSDSDDDPPPPPDRMANNDWCRCGNCMPIDQPIQCRCCMEVPNCRRFLDDCPCITMHDDFARVCLQRVVLRTALVARLDCRGHQRRRMPEELDNESYRYCAYRMFTYWVHELLGRGVRKVIPAYAVIKIRAAFPAAIGHRYVGFRWHPDGEKVEVPEEMAI